MNDLTQQMPTSVSSDFSTQEDSAKEQVDKDKDNSALWDLFVEDVERYDRKCESWHKIADDFIKKYRDEGKNTESQYEDDRVSFNVLWSNIQTTLPALYSRIPKVVAQRRWKDKDSIGRIAAIIAERAPQYEVSIQEHQFDSVMNYVVLDRLLPGRGTAWVRYEPTFDPTTQTEELPDGTVIEERVKVDYVYFKDFGHTEGRTWADVQAVWKRVFMTREAVKERFGEDIARSIDYSEKPEDLDKDVSESALGKHYKRAVIYERWDKKRGKVYWFSKGHKDSFLDVSEPPCRFREFFPCPEPLFATLTARDLIPTPDYKLYRRLADDLDYITKRKSSLMEVVRLVGTHDASVSEIMIKLKDADDGDSIPVKQWAQFAEKGGFKGVMQWFPLEEVAQTINLLTQAQADLLEKIYEVTGMSDIIRGNSNPNETATAQQIKGQFATLRLSKKQADVQRFISDIVQRIADIIFEHFDDQTILNMVGAMSFDLNDQQMIPQALQLLRQDRFRTFQIDIETDSVLAVDEQQDKEAANEYIQSIGNLLQQASQMIQMQPELMEFVLELAKTGARRHRWGTPLEGVLDRACDQIEQAKLQAQQNPQPPPPDPEMVKAQAHAQAVQSDSQVKTQKAQSDMQIAQVLAQHQQNLDMMKAQNDAQLKQAKLNATLQMKAQEIQAKMQTNAALAQTKAMNETKAAESPPAPAVGEPIVLNLNIAPAAPTRKVVRLATDPLTGHRIGTMEDVPPDAASVV